MSEARPAARDARGGRGAGRRERGSWEGGSRGHCPQTDRRWQTETRRRNGREEGRGFMVVAFLFRRAAPAAMAAVAGCDGGKASTNAGEKCQANVKSFVRFQVHPTLFPRPNPPSKHPYSLMSDRILSNLRPSRIFRPLTSLRRSCGNPAAILRQSRGNPAQSYGDPAAILRRFCGGR